MDQVTLIRRQPPSRHTSRKCPDTIYVLHEWHVWRYPRRQLPLSFCRRYQNLPKSRDKTRWINTRARCWQPDEMVQNLAATLPCRQMCNNRLWKPPKTGTSPFIIWGIMNWYTHHAKKTSGSTLMVSSISKKHIGNTVNKANRVLGITNKTFDHMGQNIFCHISKGFVRPQLECVASIWSP